MGVEHILADDFSKEVRILEEGEVLQIFDN